ncbi:Sec-independent protein translocase protein TatB [Accumulibacter sp.]|jgi:sec-independent protein translocase protein TatB|uniref:Sec-independent protein translocase protein TatB n=1 Tax=Accumulibacter regalis TaxID=522306 RepID=C7RN99_ACCRE|nr:Sec-independent protein translocase protein TatB [Accumulibacter sp.]MBN8497191.1 twin-arginine translocase subunit TatB [Accumulibacter sp.]MBO3717254.1 twin-arginine translocase subunit TatB [Accumulibacter sp.]
MFDIGFSEMIVIAIVALVVIGPERLPRVARTAGLLLGRLQRYVSDVKSDINREIQLDELKKLQSEIRDSARSVEQSLTSGVQEVRQTAQSVTESLTPTPAAVPAQPASPGDAQAPAAAPPVVVPAEQPKSTP